MVLVCSLGHYVRECAFPGLFMALPWLLLLSRTLASSCAPLPLQSTSHCILSFSMNQLPRFAGCFVMLGVVSGGALRSVGHMHCLRWMVSDSDRHHEQACFLSLC